MFEYSCRSRSDYNTRWSGIQPDEYTKAALTLSAARAALDALISADTIIIGHALDNDLRALRMVHLRCVDTVTLFPHRMGAPYRMKLRDLYVNLR
jgi:RNA exonuclease 1